MSFGVREMHLCICRVLYMYRYNVGVSLVVDLLISKVDVCRSCIVLFISRTLHAVLCTSTASDASISG